MKRVRSYVFRAGDAPTEIQLWNFGDNATDYGVHVWNARSAREVIGTYEARGNMLQIDVEHNNADAPGTDDPPPQGGYARLELRGGVPWLVFDWSEYALNQIRTRQRLYLSPEYDVDRTTNEIVRLVRVSLVADPGTHFARMLARARRVRAENGSNLNLALILAALRAALSAEDPETSRTQISTLIDEISKMAGDGGGGEEGGAPTQPETAAADPAPSDSPAPSDDGDEEKKRSFASATATNAAPEVLAMAQRLAQLEASDRVRSAEARVTAAGNRIPQSLRAFARTLSASAFTTFVAGLPEQPAEIEAEAPTRLRAAARVTRGDASGRPEGELDAETARHMARVFGNETRPDTSIVQLGNGRVRASHLHRRPVATASASEGA